MPPGAERARTGVTKRRRSKTEFSTAGTLRMIAPAKLNLGLWILRKRPDGYHDLLTVFQAIDLCDELDVTVTDSPDLLLTTDRPGIPVGEENLVIRAARLLRAEAVRRDTEKRRPGRRPKGSAGPASGAPGLVPGGKYGAVFHLRKRIPDGAGLGGGSSDAAAALVALNRLWRLDFPLSALRRLALEAGSDVPFFLTGGTAVGRGRGNRLTPLRRDKNYWFVLFHSRERISTKWAYSQFNCRLTALAPPPRIAALSSGEGLSRVPIKDLYNALEAGLTTRYPDIVERRERLLALGATAAHLTGSGSTVYGLFSGREPARKAALRLRKRGFDIDLCGSVGHGVAIEGDVGQGQPAVHRAIRA